MHRYGVRLWQEEGSIFNFVRTILEDSRDLQCRCRDFVHLYVKAKITTVLFSCNYKTTFKGITFGYNYTTTDVIHKTCVKLILASLVNAF